ncbi:MAG: DUF3857 domain-containing protein [Flammeovirgaceae bacterium]
MKQSCLLTLSLLFTTLISFHTFAQKAPMKFGKIDKAELELATCPIDQDADAMILTEYGNIGFDYDSEGYPVTEFYYHVRLKIFNKDAYDWSDVTIPFYVSNNANREKVTMIKAASYHLDGGKVITTKMSNKTVHEEQIATKVYLKKFAIPNVKEGSIIEYSYKITSDFIQNLRNWEFQTTIPVKWSEYRVSIPKGFDYQQIPRGNPNFTVQTEERVAQTYTGSSAQTEATMYRWVAENMAGLKEEPYNAHAKDYATQIEFQLKSITFPNGQFRNFATNYDSFTKTVWKTYGYADVFNGVGNGYIKKIAANLVANQTTTMEKAVTLYEHVKQRMAVQGNSYYTAQTFKKCYDEQKGKVADINLLLAIMLKEVGVPVSPVLVSTRSNGRPHPLYPNNERFNYVVLLTEIDGSHYFIDAANSNALPFGMLPQKCLNGQGLLLGGGGYRWLSLQSGAKANSVTYAKFTLTETGELEGSIDITLKTYDALRARNSETGTDDQKVLEQLKENLSDWEVSEATWSQGNEIYKPLKLSFNMQRELDDVDMIYLNPSIYGLEDENPFKSKERNLPIDFPYHQGRKFILSFTLPEGYVVDELPKPTRLTLPNKGGTFLFNISQNGQIITLVNDMKLKQNFFKVEEYETLRNFFDMIVAKNAEQIVIKRATK